MPLLISTEYYRNTIENRGRVDEKDLYVYKNSHRRLLSLVEYIGENNLKSLEIKVRINRVFIQAGTEIMQERTEEIWTVLTLNPFNVLSEEELVDANLFHF